VRFKKCFVRSNSLRHLCGNNISHGATISFGFGDFLKQFAVHLGFFWVHHAAELEFSFKLNVRGVPGSVHVRVHLLNLESLRRFNLLLSGLFFLLSRFVIHFGLERPLLHERSVSAFFDIFGLAFGVHLCVEHIPYLLVLLACDCLLVQLLQADLLVLLDALLDVLSFLSLLKLFIFVVDDVCHLVHQCLDPGTAFSHNRLTLALLFVLQLDHFLNFFVLRILALLLVGKAFLLLFLIFSNNLHRSLSFLELLNLSVLLFCFDLCDELLCLVTSLLHLTSLVLFLLYLGLLQHSIAHLFVLQHGHLTFLLLPLFQLDFLLRLIQDPHVEVLFFFGLSLTLGFPLVDLLVQDLLDFLLLLGVHRLLLSNVIFVQHLAIALNFAPFI